MNISLMPELLKEIAAKRNKSFPLAERACTAANIATANRKAGFAALAAEVKAIRDAGRTPDVDALWRKHFPGVPLRTPSALPPHSLRIPSAFPNLARNSAHPNAQSSPATTSTPAMQAAATQPFATTAPGPAEPPIAQNP